MVGWLLMILLYPLLLLLLYHFLWRLRIAPMRSVNDPLGASEHFSQKVVGKWLCAECRLMFYRYRVRYGQICVGMSGVLVLGFFGGIEPQWVDGFFLLLMLPLMAFDGRYQLLPDPLVYPLLWSGILCALLDLSILTIELSVWGVVVAYGVMLMLYIGGYIRYRHEAMGRGDLKFAAAIGAWLGLDWVIMHLFLSAVMALLWIILIYGFNRKSPRKTIPFGPFLGISGIILYFITRFIMVV